jgi:DNA-binding CsgD family transcriptional regulator
MYSKYFGILQAFGIYFTKKASYIIKDVESQGKISFPCLLSNTPRNLCSLNHKESETADWCQKNIKHFFISTSSKEDIAITPRQRECLSYLALGKNYKEISRILNIDIKTVENHMQRLRDKTGLNSRSALVQSFIDSGI